MGSRRLNGLKFILLCGFFLAGAAVPPACANLVINLFAVNTSETGAKEIEVKHYLPAELDAEDILDAGPLKIEYDVDKRLYYASGKFLFNAKESRVFKIRVKDVWRISASEIDVLRVQLERNLEMLKDHEHYGYALQMRDQLNAQMDYILGQQARYSENIDRRIEEYRAYVGMLNEIRDNVYSLDFLKHLSLIHISEPTRPY